MRVDDLHKIAFRVLPADPQLVIRFFAVMSRFEYAVKQAGYSIAEDRRGYMPSWSDLQDVLDESSDCYASEKVAEAIAYLLANPPKKLNAHGDWVARRLKGRSDPAQALDAVVGVRNNLFHGKKGDVRARNDRIFDCSLCVLDAVMQDRKEIRNAYMEAYS